MAFLSARPPLWVLGLCLLALGWFFLSLLKPGIIGFYYDDGAYFSAAKALSEGLGYVFPNEPTWTAVVKYPPLFALILAPLWWAFPQFPENIWWF